MNRDEKPLFTLTVRQFSELTKSIVAEEIKKVLDRLQESENNSKSDCDICDIDKTCKITGLKRSSLYSKISLKQIPCLSRRRPLLFSQKHLEMWIAAGRPKTNDMNQIQVILQQKGMEKK